MNDTEGWVTVAEAARRLGISERQARRDVRRLAEDDRRASGATPGRSPARVRLAALRDLRDEAQIEDRPPAGVSGPSPAVSGAGVRPAPDDDRPESGGVFDARNQTAEEDRPAPEREADARSEMVEQLRAENARLNAALERAQMALSQALGALSTEQERTRQLESTQTRLIEALPAAGPDTTIDPPTEAGMGVKQGWWERVWHPRRKSGIDT